MDGPGLSVGAVARRLGVAPSTLRTWDRRYGIGPSRRSAGSHRRYDVQDVARLEHMNRLILQGAPPEEAARAALAGKPPNGGTAGPETGAGSAAATAGAGEAAGSAHGSAAGHAGHTAHPPDAAHAAHASDPAEAAEAADAGTGGDRPVSAGRAVTTGSGKGTGGNRLAVPGATQSTRALARAAMALDDRLIDELIASALRRDGVVRTWCDLLVPVLTGAGDRFAATGAGVEIEHLLSNRVQCALAPLTVRPLRPVNDRPVLLACAAEEQHSLPVHALGAALTAERVAVRILGGRTPYSALADAIERTGPGTVFVWSQIRATGDPAPLAELPGRRPALRLVVGGPGWAYDRLPEGVRPVSTLPEAVTEIRVALGLS